MNVLIVHNFLWAHYKSCLFAEMHRQSAAVGINLHVIQIARNERSRATLEAQSGGPTYRYPYTLLFDRFIDEVGRWEKIRALFRAVRQHRPDVLMLTGYADPAQVALLVWARARGILVVMQNESTDADNSRHTLKEQLKRAVLAQCQGFFTFGQRAAAYLQHLGVPSYKLLVTGNAVVDNATLQERYERALPHRRAEQQRLGLPTRNFIYVGRFSAEKNLLTLIDAFAVAQHEHPADWGLLLLGDGPAHEMLQRHAEYLGVRVHWLPGRAWYNVPAALALADVLVLPSQSEPWGLVVNEAMACGLPVVVSERCGCVPDLVEPNVTGFVFDPQHARTLADHLLRFMRGHVDYAALSAGAQRRIARFAPEPVARQMLAALKNLAPA